MFTCVRESISKEYKLMSSSLVPILYGNIHEVACLFSLSQFCQLTVIPKGAIASGRVTAFPSVFLQVLTPGRIAPLPSFRFPRFLHRNLWRELKC